MVSTVKDIFILGSSPDGFCFTMLILERELHIGMPHHSQAIDLLGRNDQSNVQQIVF